ncbi:hypothetical protein BQ9231_00262 [Cedratvirus lausannensis]|uniref:Uncharacterized protein n=1 Tax=Cedratvirus lausannensis TaxID=2023205 RepID=A0A285Q1R5_9VIRU|nr:hypothetical protein BQ9231_00262 [Cedratvirus lausannensis]
MSITSWLGYEELREEVRELAYKVYNTDKEARENVTFSGKNVTFSGEGNNSVAVTGLICQGIRDPSLVQDEKILEASMAQLQLRDLHEKLVKNFGFDWHTVRNVWAPILDPKIPPWETSHTKQ